MATNTLGFSAVVLSLTLLKQSQLESSQLGWFIAALVAFAGVAASTIYALWLRPWSMSPPLGDLFKNIESLKYDDEALSLWSGNLISNSVNSNKKNLRMKAWGLRAAYIFLSFEVLFIGIIIITSFVLAKA